MAGIGGGVAVGQDQPALPAIPAPVGLVGDVPVDAVKGGGRIDIDLLQAADFPIQVHLHRNGGLVSIVREGDAAHRGPGCRKALGQQAGLGGLAAAIQPFDDDQAIGVTVR